MSYHITKEVAMSFDEAEARVTAELQREGFGVLTKIDVQATLREKLGVEFRRYTILGACNPAFAHQALLAEDRIGLLLPCNVVVQERAGTVEVSAVDPRVAMAGVENARLSGIAEEVRARLARVIQHL